MSRGGVSKTRGDEPERRCIATGDVQPRSGLIRFVLDSDGVVVPDLLGKLPGRGVYVAADRAALEMTVKKALFSRGFKQPAKAVPELIDQIDAMLIRRVTDLISLVRKSGDAIAGYEKVKDWLMRETAHVLIQASDGSERGKSKLSTPYKGVFIGFLTADELGMAFGRQTVIHAALASGGLTPRVVEEAQRLQGVRGIDGGTGRLKGKKAS
ncbi:MAG: RNA-binding protein [Marinibacterium sp.]|nr:RNA-binding protein [Marinibacterium sp.]